MSEKTIDPAVEEMLALAAEMKIETFWDRYQAQLPQCEFGLRGICCRNCLHGPCRIDPFKEGAQKGVCGATADTIVARNFVRTCAGGAAAHIDHARHVLEVIEKIAHGHATGYKVTDKQKLENLAQRLGIQTKGKSEIEVLKELAKEVAKEFQRQEGYSKYLQLYTTKKRFEKLAGLNVLPPNLDLTITESLHRTTMGVDADPVNLILGAVKVALADGAALHMSTDLQDILFGTPKPLFSKANLGVLREDSVNIAVHGHVPLLSAKVAEQAEKLEKEASSAGARGINVVGICCTGHEVLERYGVPLAQNFLGSEMAVATGALDAMIVDVQCIAPSLITVADCFHTKLITTFPIAKIPEAEHIEFTTENADEATNKMIKIAIEAFKKRDKTKVHIPKYEQKILAGFSVEAIVGALSKVDPSDPLKPLLDNIVKGNILGAALFAGCNNVKLPQDKLHVTMAKGLLEKNVLILSTGCAGYALAKAGLMSPEATFKYAGEGLKAVLTAVGKAAGLNGPLPPVLNIGSCVDNSRAVVIVNALADKLGVDVEALPVVACAPEALTEKAIAIGTWAVSLGIPVHIGIVPPIIGSNLVTEIATSKAKDIFGGYFIVEPDPAKAVDKLIAVIDERRSKLGLKTSKEI